MNLSKYKEIESKLKEKGVKLVAVSKTKPAEDIHVLYKEGQRVFGENKVQELCDKVEQLPDDIQWHMIGHLQRNKVKYIAPFVALIHGVDSLKLLKEINKQGRKNERKIPVLLQMHIAEEESKFGLDKTELNDIIALHPLENFPNIEICGLMGMATFTDDKEKIRREFQLLKQYFDNLKTGYFAQSNAFNELSMG
ncbi:MAG: YggS family pyridoxal phosphate-dependent enzyme, partial [Chitinophagales bacterium]